MLLRAMAMLVVLLSFLVGPALAQTTQPSTQRRVMIVTVDGMRPDLLLRAKAPHLQYMLQQGAFTMWAQTTAMSITLPSHVSLLTGVTPDRHGITHNGDLPSDKTIYPSVPTIFEEARKAGYTTAMVAGKSKLVALNRPGSLDWVFIPGKAVATDKDVADQACAMIRAHQPQVFFVHLPDSDSVGHAHGWGSPEHLETLAKADAALGRLVSALDEVHLLQTTLILVTADHGGSGKTHGPDDPRSRHIPWIALGPGVRAGYDLTLQRERTIRIEDTFATALQWLGIAIPQGIDGKPVDIIFAEPAKPAAN